MNRVFVRTVCMVVSPRLWSKSGGVWAVDTFRDASPALVIREFRGDRSTENVLYSLTETSVAGSEMTAGRDVVVRTG